jgi:hypothetical protein
MDQSREHSQQGLPSRLEAKEKPGTAPPAPHPGKQPRLEMRNDPGSPGPHPSGPAPHPGPPAPRPVHDDPGSGPAPHPGRPPGLTPREGPGVNPAPHPGPPAPRVEPAPHPGPPRPGGVNPAPHPGPPARGVEPGPHPGPPRPGGVNPAPHPGPPAPRVEPAPHPGPPAPFSPRNDPGSPGPHPSGTAPHPGPPPARHASASLPLSVASPVAGVERESISGPVDVPLKHTREIACEKPVRNTSFSAKSSIVGIVPFSGTPKAITLVGNTRGETEVTFLFTDGTSDKVAVSVVE